MNIKARSAPPCAILTELLSWLVVACGLGPGAASIVKVSGDQQSAAPGQPLDFPLVVQVNDLSNKPLANISVDFAADPGSGSVNPTRATTGPNGQAKACWTLGGGHVSTATATVPHAGSLTFTAYSGSPAPPSPTAGVWGQSGNDVFAVGRSILHYDGAAWSRDTSWTGLSLAGVWGTSGRDVFAVGYQGEIVHFDGSAWLEQARGGAFKSLHDVWGASSSDVFAVGDSGTILHYDGKTWAQQTSGTTAHLHGVWGVNGSDVFAVGDNGTVLHYNGATWSPQTSGTTQPLRAVWGSSSVDVFAVGGSVTGIPPYGGGGILHYNGVDWVQQDTTRIMLTGIWGATNSDIYAVGTQLFSTGPETSAFGTMVHYNGVGWAQAGPQIPLLHVWGASTNDVFAVGYLGMTILHYDGTGWAPQNWSCDPSVALPAARRSLGAVR